MNLEECKVGKIVKVKKEAWDEWCLRSESKHYREPPPEQPIVSVDGYVMLAFPLWWWRPEELEEP